MKKRKTRAILAAALRKAKVQMIDFGKASLGTKKTSTITPEKIRATIKESLKAIPDYDDAKIDSMTNSIYHKAHNWWTERRWRAIDLRIFERMRKSSPNMSEEEVLLLFERICPQIRLVSEQHHVPLEKNKSPLAAEATNHLRKKHVRARKALRKQNA